MTVTPGYWLHICLKTACLSINSELKFKLKLNYDRQSVGQSVLVSDTHLGPATNFSVSLKLSLASRGFVILELPLWREDGSVIYCYCWFSPTVSWDSRPLSQFLRLPQPGGPGPRIYIPQEQGGPPSLLSLYCLCMDPTENNASSSLFTVLHVAVAISCNVTESVSEVKWSEVKWSEKYFLSYRSCSEKNSNTRLTNEKWSLVKWFSCET
jgi:hypothetical protein